MSYTMTLLDQFKAARKIESDYGAAKALGLSQPAVSNYRNGTSHADDRIAIVLADALGLDRLKTIARINAERAKKPEDRAFWKRIATAAAIVLAVYTSLLPINASASRCPALLKHNSGQVHIMSNDIGPDGFSLIFQ